jgi:hypothetical protein
MRKRRIKRTRKPRRLFPYDPTTNPAPGSEELEAWDNEIEDWMIAGTK